MVRREPRDKPPEYEDDLGDYGPWITDGNCGKTVGWGFKIQRHLGEERFRALGGFGSLECVNGQHLETTWYVVTDWLTPSEATEEYGPISRLVVGPQKGFRSVTYGRKSFTCDRLDPRSTGIDLPPGVTVKLQKGDRRLVID